MTSLLFFRRACHVHALSIYTRAGTLILSVLKKAVGGAVTERCSIGLKQFRRGPDGDGRSAAPCQKLCSCKDVTTQLPARVASSSENLPQHHTLTQCNDFLAFDLLPSLPAYATTLRRLSLYLTRCIIPFLRCILQYLPLTHLSSHSRLLTIRFFFVYLE